MGLLKASVVFILGNFVISLMTKNVDIIEKFPVLGHTFGPRIKKFIPLNSNTYGKSLTKIGLCHGCVFPSYCILGCVRVV